MPNWNDVLREINSTPATPDAGALDIVRRKYLQQLNQHTQRNIIAYYSGWLQKPGLGGVQINDDDKNGFMATVHGLDRKHGLDLILHTPGGDTAATESLVYYLKRMFGSDIRAIVPQIAMSAGTMIACACKEIVMGKQSNIGPFDPQYNGIPCYGVIEEFDEAVREVIKDPRTTPIWQQIVAKYHPTFVGECKKAIDLCEQVVQDWLMTGMFSGDADAKKKVADIIYQLNNHADTKTHARHIHIDAVKAMGLKVVELESDSTLQDLCLTVHHAYMHTLASSPAIKIIENHLGNAVVQLGAIGFMPTR